MKDDTRAAPTSRRPEERAADKAPKLGKGPGRKREKVRGRRAGLEDEEKEERGVKRDKGGGGE